MADPKAADDQYLPRHIDSTLEDVLGSFPIVVVDGPLGAGKTTTASRFARTVIELPAISTDSRSTRPHCWLICRRRC